MGWSPLKTPVDWIILGGLISPGYADVSGADSPREWDQRQGYGLSGAFPVFKGVKLSEFDIKLRLYTQEDWDRWYDWKPIVDKPSDGKRPRALDIYHPFLQELQIRSVVVVNVTQPEPIEDGSVFEIKISMLTWRKPKIMLVKPVAGEEQPKKDWVDELEERLAAEVERGQQEIASVERALGESQLEGVRRGMLLRLQWLRFCNWRPRWLLDRALERAAWQRFVGGLS